MFEIDDSGIKQLERDLKTFAKKALPFATKNTLNRAAFDTQRESREIIDRKMTTRNRFTMQSIRVDQARTLNIKNQSAHVGSTADYMEDQEFGATKTGKGKHGVSIPTGYAAGQEGQQPRTRLPRKANKLQTIQLQRRQRRVAKNNKQSLLFKVQDAVTTGRRFFFHDFGGGKKSGIFRVTGGRRNFKRGWPKGAQLKMVHDLTTRSVIIPRSPWLSPAVSASKRKLPEFYRESLQFQAKRHKLFD